MKPVPHYEQQYEFTCGPASLMMIFKHFDRKFVLNKKIETDLWRESSLAPLPPTSRYGLAFSALKRGHKVEVLTNVAGIEYVSKTPASLTGRRGGEWIQRFMQLMKAQFEERKQRAVDMGLKEKKVRKVTLKHVEDALKRRGLGIMLTSARFFDDEDWAHWVVLVGVDNKNVYINDPSSKSKKGRRVFSRREFESINSYYGDQVLISIFR
jgi:predicted double-glycine peptidase